jgi:hypothetical protein
MALMILVAPAALAKTLDSHTERTFRAIPGGTVSVDVSFHDVKVDVEPGDEVKITVDIEVQASASKAQDLIDELEPRFNERDSTISVRSARKGGFSFSLFGSTRMEGQVVVRMPPGMNLSVDTAYEPQRRHGLG